MLRIPPALLFCLLPAAASANQPATTTPMSVAQQAATRREGTALPAAQAAPLPMQGRLSPQAATAVAAIESGFAHRRNTLLLLNLGLGLDVAQEADTSAETLGKAQLPVLENRFDLYGSYSAMLLREGVHTAEANALVRRVAEWFEHPHPHGFDHRGEVDFPALELARLYCGLQDSPVLEEATKERIRSFFLTRDFKSMHASENHALVFVVARYLMASQLPQERFTAYGGKTGAALAKEDAKWLKAFIRYRARYGWGEFDAGNYSNLDFNALISLYDYAPDADLVDLARKGANLLLLDHLVDTLNGLHGGARGRVTEALVLDHAGGVFNDLRYLYFGIGDIDPEADGLTLLSHKRLSRWELSHQALYSSFRPEPIVCAVARLRTLPYTNLERRHLHNMLDTLPAKPLKESIRKSTLLTKGYTLGAVQFQDPYPAGTAANYAKHQQHEWDFTIAEGGSTKARIFTHHPGPGGLHTYWRGAHSSNFVNTFQQGTAVLAMWDIPPSQPYQLIHAYFPAAEFDQIIEQEGWIFARKGEVYAALYLDGGYQWVRSGENALREITSDGSKKASVFEAGSEAESGSFEAFREAILGNSVHFDTEAMQLRYASARNGTIAIDAKGLREVNGKAMNLDYPTQGSPYLYTAWGSPQALVTFGDASLLLDFTQRTSD